MDAAQAMCIKVCRCEWIGLAASRLTDPYNHSRHSSCVGWPKFIMSGVQTEYGRNNSIVVSGYSPYSANLGDGTAVVVGGQYPFADNVTVSVTRPESTDAWSLALRIPCWADAATVTVIGPTCAVLPATPCALFAVPPAVTGSLSSLNLSITFQHSIKVWHSYRLTFPAK